MTEQNSYEKAQEIIRLREAIGKQEQANKTYDYKAGTVTTKPNWSINLPRPPQSFENPEMADRYAKPYIHDQGPWNAPVTIEGIKQQPTPYWNQGSRIGRYYFALQSLPPGTPPPQWLDKQGIEAAYNYLKETRPNEHWTDWGEISPDDPVNTVLSQMLPPPPSMMPSWERETLQKRYEALHPPGEYTPDPEAREMSGSNMMLESQYKDLPIWKKGAQALTPVIQLGFGVAGGVALGARFGIGGAVVGAVGMGGGTYLSMQIQKKIDNGEEVSEQELDFLKKFALLDWAEIQMEKSEGLGQQIWASLFQPEKYGELNEIFGSWENFKAAYDAGALFYESFMSSFEKKVEGWEQDVANQPKLEQALYSRGNFWQNIFNPDVEGFTQKLEELYGDQYAKDGKLTEDALLGMMGWKQDTRQREEDSVIVGAIITSNEDIVTRLPNGQDATPYFMKLARDRIQKGESANDVYMELSQKFGYWGSMRDLMGSLLLDPLDQVGPAANKILSTTGKITGHPTLTEAFVNTHRSPIENTRLYGQLIRSKPAAEAAQYSAFSRWVAGIDKAGDVKSMAQLQGNPMNWLFGLTPKAKASQLLTSYMDGIYNLVAPEKDIKVFTNMIKTIAKFSPGDAIKGAEGPTMKISVGGEMVDVNVPGWYMSTEAQLLPTALKDSIKPVDELLDTYNLADGQRQIIKRVAEYMGKTGEDFVAELHKMTADQANTMYKKFLVTLGDLKAKGDPSAGKLLDMLTKKEATKNYGDVVTDLTGAELKKIAAMFFGDKGVPFNADILKFRMLESIENAMSKFAVDYYGVKPDPALLRLANVSKKAQSLLLLGLSPTYFFNNAINNLVTMQWDGILHLGYEYKRQQLMEDFGFIPINYTQGAGAAEYGQIDMGQLSMFGMKSKPVGSEINKAAQSHGGFINNANNLMSGKFESVQIFAKWSQATEKWNSQIAIANGISEYMNRAHRVGKGIPPMPDGLKAMLEGIKPGLAKRVEKMIERNISKAKIEKTIWGEGGPGTSIRDFLDPDSIQALDHFGILKEVDERLTKATTTDHIYQVFQDVKNKLQDEINNQVVRNMDKITKDVAAKSQIEGPQGVLDIYDTLTQIRVDMFARHFDFMAEVAETASKKKGIDRSLIYTNGKGEANRNWTIFQNIEGAKTLGILTGLGLDRTKPLYSEAFNLIADGQINWKNFHAQQQKLFAQFEADAYGLEWGDPRSTELWYKYNEDVNALYIEASIKEMSYQARLDQIFADLYEKQFPGKAAEAEKWRNAVGTQRRRMIQAQALWRTGTIPENLLKWGDLLGKNIKDAIIKLSEGRPIYKFNRQTRDIKNPKFYKEIYTQLVKDLSYESNRTAPGMPETPTAAEIPPEGAAALDAEMPPQGEGIPVFITQKMRADLKDLGYTTEDISQMTPEDAWQVINSGTRKIDVETVTPEVEPETTPEVTPEITTPDTTPTTTEGDLFGQQPTEAPAPKKQVFNNTEQEIWKIVNESKPDLNPIDEAGTMNPDARLNLIKYILKHSVSAKKKMTVGPDGKWTLHWKDVMPDDLRQAIAMEQQAIDAQPSMFGEESPAVETAAPMSDEEISQVNFVTNEPITPAAKITPEQQALVNAQRNYDRALQLKEDLEFQMKHLQSLLPQVKVGKEAAERVLLDHLKSIKQSDRFQHVRLVWEGFAADWARNHPGMKPEDWYETFFVGRGGDSENVDAADLSQLRYNTQLIEAAIEKFGTTHNIKEAGFILPDGTLLDLSGRSQAGGYRRVGTRFMVEKGRDYLSDQRSLDHRETISLMPYSKEKSLYEDRLAHFMAETGAIRIDANSQIVDAASKLTREQINVIKSYFDEYTHFDITDPKTGQLIESINPNNRNEFNAAIQKINDRFKQTPRQQEFDELYQEIQMSLLHDDVLQGLKPNVLIDGKKWKVSLEGTKIRFENAKTEMTTALQNDGYYGSRLDDILKALDRGEVTYYEIDPNNVGAQGPVRKYVFFQSDPETITPSKSGWSWLRMLANEYIQARYALDVDKFMTELGLTEYGNKDMTEYFRTLEDKRKTQGFRPNFLYQDSAGKPKKPQPIVITEQMENYARMLLRSTDKEILSAIYLANTRDEKIQIFAALNKQDPVRAKQIYELAMENKSFYLWQEENAPTFYMQSEKFVLDKMPDRMKKNSLIALLKNNIKPEELEFTGLLDEIARGPETIKKEDVLFIINANKLDLKEVTYYANKSNATIPKPEDKYITPRLVEYDPETNMWEALVPNSFNRYEEYSFVYDEFITGELTREKVIEMAQDDAINAYYSNYRHYNPVMDVKYSDFALKGGNDYRELLLTIPESRIDFKRYTSSHWEGQVNPVAHIRFQEFVSPDNARVLHIEEIQSDWHQQGEKYGIISELPPRVRPDNIQQMTVDYYIKDADDRFLLINRSNKEIVHDSYKTNTPNIKDAAAKLLKDLQLYGDSTISARRNKAVPSAPFKSTWAELAMKRMIRYAAENGYDRISWTTGETQISRYNLAKGYKEIEWRKEFPDVMGDVKLILHTREFMGSQSQRRELDLAAWELADKVGEEIDNIIRNSNATHGSLKGDDLKIGKKGMPYFYDEKLPNKVNKYIKKWNSKVVDDQITVRTGSDYYRYEPLKVHAFDLTPEMREAVMSQGQSLFQQKRGSTRWIDDGLAVMHLFENADISTIVHETVHVYTPQMSQAHSNLVRTYIQGLTTKDLPQNLIDKFKVDPNWKTKITEDWHLDPINNQLEAEILSTAFERYMTEGKSPIKSLTEVFESFKKWMLEIYKSITGNYFIDIKLDANVKKVFDEWMAGDKLEELKNASTKPPLDWAEYIKLKDTMNEERLYIEAGTINGVKVSPEYMEVLKRNYAKHKAIVDELDKIYDKPVVRPGFEAEMARSQIERVTEPVKEPVTDLPGEKDLRALGWSDEEIVEIANRPVVETEDWNMTVDQFVEQSRLKKDPKQYSKKDEEFARTAHKIMVRNRVQRGLEVPPEVLADYPELQVTRLPDPAPQETMFTGKKPRQEGFFDATGEDLPLLSGTAQRAQADIFAPQEVAPQDALFDMRQQLPIIEGRQAVGGAEGTPLFGEQPIETSPQPTIIESGGIDATQTEAGRTGLPESGRTGTGVQSGRTDSRRSRDASGRLIIARSERTKAGNAGLVPQNVLEHLAPHQADGVAKAIEAFQSDVPNKRGFILADGTGAGKTRQELAIAKTYADQGRPVVIITKAEVIKADWKKGTFAGSFKNDADTMGMELILSPYAPGFVEPGKVYLSTYERMERFFWANGIHDAVVIFDEAHALKNADSKRAKAGMDIAGVAHAVVYASATPADKPQHIDYMSRANIFEGKSREQAYRELGLTQRTIKVGKGRNQTEIEIWVVDSSVGSTEVYKRMGQLFDRMTENGNMIKREISMDGIPVQFSKLPIDAAGKAILQKIEDAFSDGGSLNGLKKALVLMHQRRQQEPMKIPVVKNMVKQELDAGRQVVVFLSRVNDSDVIKRIKVGRGEFANIIEEIIHSSEGTVKTLKKELEAMGIKDIAELHGGSKEAAPDSMDKFQTGKARVMLATLESGGTGINLDDITGDAPRTIIFMTAPFSAVENIQGAGRVWRMTTKSQPKIMYLFGDTPTDQWNAAIIAEKMKMLGATVEGEVRKLDIPEDMDTDLYLRNLQEDYGNEPKTGELYQEGAPKDVKTIALDPEQNQYEFEYKVVELDDLITSHTDALGEDPRYPQELQPRERDRAASQAQIDDIAKRLNPLSYILDQHATDRGTPTIGKGNMIVESGNGRTIALRRARAAYPEKFKAYQDAVRTAAEEYGLSTEGFENPVLVRERITEDIDLEKFTAVSNKKSSADLSDYEMAVQDLKFVSDEMLAKLKVAEGETVTDALMKDSNQEVVRDFIKSVPVNEYGKFMTDDGELSNTGAARMTYAMMLKVFPDEAGKRLLKVLTDNSDEGIINLHNVLLKTMGELAMLESKARSGVIPADLAIADDLTKAIDTYMRLKQQNVSPIDYVKQTSIFEKELNDFQGALLLFINANKRSEAKLRRMISAYVKSAVSQDTPGQDVLFGAPPTKGEILDGIAKTLGRETDFASTTRAEEIAPAAISTTGEVVDSTIEQPTRTEPVRPQPEEPVARPIPEPIEETEQPAVGAPFGTADQVLPPPYDEMLYEGWLKDIMPALEDAQNKMMSADIPDKTSLGSQLTKDQQKELRKYLGNVYSEMTNTKMGALQYAMGKRDFALHDYTKRTGADNILGGFFPYQFWYTRSALNWFLRLATNPGILADYYRIMSFGQQSEDKEGYPNRLKNKVGIPVPFLPDWMGKNIYVDPFKQIFPFRQLTAPFRQMQDEANMLNKKTMGIIQQQLEDGEITDAQAQEAIQKKSGDVWETAMRDVRSSSQLEFENPLDYATALISPSLPLSLAYNLSPWGDKEKIRQLPVTRSIQALTSMAGIGGPRGWNIEAPFRKGFGLDEIDQFETYRINRELSNMVADGLVDPQTAIKEMVDGKGPNYTEAQKRVAKQMNPRTFFSSVGLDFFPEGEQEMRSIAVEYGNALDAYFDGGDKQALTKFWDEFPEYEARIASNNTEDPEKMLRTFLKSRIWQGFNELNSYEKEQAIKSFGQKFELSFLNKDTRNYDDISTETYASWAKTLGSEMPSEYEDATEIPGAQIPEAVSNLLDTYIQERDRKFPGISETLSKLYSMDVDSQSIMRKNTPVIEEYQNWRNKFIASNPAVAEYLTGEQSELYGLPPQIQVAVYQYRDQVNDYFPDIYAKQEAYFDISNSAQKKNYLKQHPELPAYWDFRREYAAAYPQAAPYILSDESLAKYILGEDRSQQTQEVQIPDGNNLDPALLRLLGSYYYGGRELPSGARAELSRLWKAAGSPAGSMENWLNAYVWPSLK